MDHHVPDPLFSARKRGRTIELERDPDPSTSEYLALEAPGMLVLFAVGREPSGVEHGPPIVPLEPGEPPPRRDETLRRAFDALSRRVASTALSTSAKPFTELLASLRGLAAEPAVAEDVRTYLASNPSVRSGTEMLFTSMAMSARADWRTAPSGSRNIAARGWFLGRWIPTFLVLDGPILRFLKSPAFSRSSKSSLLRAARRFFEIPEFMRLRHAIAHWSFSWEVVDGDSLIVGAGKTPSDPTVRIPRAEADAYHIITFGVIEAIHEAFLREPAKPAGDTSMQG